MTLPLDWDGPVGFDGASGKVKFIRYPMLMGSMKTANRTFKASPQFSGEYTQGKTYEFKELVKGTEDWFESAIVVDDNGEEHDVVIEEHFKIVEVYHG